MDQAKEKNRKTWWIVLVVIAVLTIGGIVGHHAVKYVMTPTQVTIPSIGKNPPFTMEAIPISRIGRNDSYKGPTMTSTFKELW